MTAEEYEAALRERFPSQTIEENGVVRQMTPQEYEAWISANVEGVAIAQARKTKATQFVQGMETLRTDLTKAKNKPAFDALTAAQKSEQLRLASVDILQSLVWLGETLVDAGFVRVDG